MSLHTLRIYELLIMACVLACMGCNWNGKVGAFMICVEQMLVAPEESEITTFWFLLLSEVVTVSLTHSTLTVQAALVQQIEH